MHLIRTAMLSFLPTPCFAQLTIDRAIGEASGKYPGVRAPLEQLNAAAAVTLARTSFLPQAGTVAQINRATHNNVFGTLFPAGAIPSMSGPMLRTNSLGSAWGDGGGGDGAVGAVRFRPARG
jgi:outer membrane protein